MGPQVSKLSVVAQPVPVQGRHNFHGKIIAALRGNINVGLSWDDPCHF